MPPSLTRCRWCAFARHEKTYRHETLECRLGTHLTLGDGLSVGDVAYALRVVRSDAMSELRLSQWVANVGGERGEMAGEGMAAGALMSPGRCRPGSSTSVVCSTSCGFAPATGPGTACTTYWSR